VEELLTACIWAEARDEPEEGWRAVCNVILNRVKKRMAPTVREVILQPAQFSWTSPNDPNYSKVLTAKNDDPSHWERASEITSSALTGALDDNTRNADHYLNVEATKKANNGVLPKWVQEGLDQHKVTVIIGHHTFLNLRG
jgi:spore germination cell wall hydrolase CwlJ-like protein